MEIEIKDDGKGKRQSVEACAEIGLIVHPMGHFSASMTGCGFTEDEARAALIVVRDELVTKLAALAHAD